MSLIVGKVVGRWNSYWVWWGREEEWWGRGSIDGLGGGVGGYVMVFGGEGLEGECELEWRKGGWG